MPDKEIGKVVHWFDKISVAVIKLNAPLANGDTVKFVKGDEEFEEIISSMQIEHENVEKAKKGDEVAIKVSQKAKDGAVVFKIE